MYTEVQAYCKSFSYINKVKTYCLTNYSTFLHLLHIFHYDNLSYNYPPNHKKLKEKKMLVKINEET